MTPLDKLINQRRSIRKYKADIPPADSIEKMIFAATCAPSPSNSQPALFIRIASTKTKDRIHEALLEGYQTLLHRWKERDGSKKTKNLINAYKRYSEFMFDVPVLFAVGIDQSFSGFSKRLFDANIIAEDRRKDTDLDISTGLALKGFILKGEELGLSACILTAPLVFIADIEKRLGLDDVRIKCFVTVGFPDEKPGYIKRKSVSEICREL